MFSGIVEEFATVVAIEKEMENVHFTLTCSFVNELKIDQSVAHNGVCLTVVKIEDGNYVVTAYWKEDDTEYLFYPESYNRVALSIANPTGMAAAGETGAQVSIANGQITVSGIDGGTTATLTDISGRVVCRRQAQGHTSVSLPTHGLPQGIYVLKVGSLCRRIRL